MKKKIYYSLAASALVLALSDAPEAYAVQDGHDHAHEQTQHTRRAGRRVSKARRRSARRASVSYVCPMHPDMRSRTRGECPKCGMSLVASKRGARPAASEVEDVGADEAHHN